MRYARIIRDQRDRTADFILAYHGAHRSINGGIYGRFDGGTDGRFVSGTDGGIDGGIHWRVVGLPTRSEQQQRTRCDHTQTSRAKPNWV